MWEGFETKKGGDQCTFSTAAVLFIMRRKDSMSLFYTSTYQGINKYDFRLNSEKFRQPCSSVARGRPESRKPAGLATAAAAAKSLQSCLTVQPHRRQPTRLCRPWDSPGKNTGVGCHCLLQCMKVKVKSLSRVQLFATPWTVAHQAPPSMGFSRQEYWSGVPLPSLRWATNHRVAKSQARLSD